MPHTLIFIDEPVLQPIKGAHRLFQLWQDWTVNLDGKELVIKKGFETDLASIPKVFENIIDNDDPCILCASIVHDYGFATRGRFWDSQPPYSFTEVNEVLRAGMAFCGTSQPIQDAVFAAVETGGFLIWQRELLTR